MRQPIIALLAALFCASCAPAPEAERDANVDPVEPAAPPKPWAPTVFVDRPEPIQVNQFFEHFGAALQKVQKGKYETTEQYEARMRDLDQAIPPFSTKAVYAFLPELSSMTYDADTAAYKLPDGVFCQDGYPIDGGINCGMATQTESADRYTGQNAFGATANVSRVTGTEFYFVFPRADLKGRQFRDGIGSIRIPVACPVPVEKAKTLDGKTIRGALLVGLRKPELLSGDTRYEEATVHSPREASYESRGIPMRYEGTVCFVEETGEVLHRATRS